MVNIYQKRYREKHPERVREQVRRWKENNPEKVRLQQKRVWENLKNDSERHERKKQYKRDWSRKHGKWERPEDSCCELCGKCPILLHYHHWNNELPELGIWVCGEHHLMIERYDKEMMAKYEGIKEERNYLWTRRGE